MRNGPTISGKPPEAGRARAGQDARMLNINCLNAAPRLATVTVGIAALLFGCATNHPANTALAPMPEAVASFGAATSEGWLYVFGGHKGRRHAYSYEMVSGSFHRLWLGGGRAWERLPCARPGQGSPLVARKGRIYRVGGMAARNRDGERWDLRLLALVQRFDPLSGRWEDLPPLPTPRSSGDAVVVGDTLYVVGGWNLSGVPAGAVWHTNAMALDLARLESGWREFPQPFRRRALALAALGSRIYCVGGMNSDNQTTLSVGIYDTATGQWAKGPDLPPGRHKGFGCSAAVQNRRLYVSAFQGDLLRLAADGASWEIAGRLQHPRLFHRLVPAGGARLIALGGEDGGGKRSDLEWLTPPARAPFAARPAESARATAVSAPQQ